MINEVIFEELIDMHDSVHKALLEDEELVSLEIDLGEELTYQSMLRAEAEGITFNEYINNALRALVGANKYV